MSLPSNEEWRPVVGYEGIYEVSNLGRVYSIRRPNASRSGRFLALNPNVRWGYLQVTLRNDGKTRVGKVHRLVAEAFLLRRDGDYLVRHLNGDILDNRVENLAWGTQSENGLDSVRHGTHNRARRTHCNHGHEFTPENTGIYKTGRSIGIRWCRMCRKEYAAANVATLVKKDRERRHAKARLSQQAS